MQLTARQQLTQFANLLQTSLFPRIEEELGVLSPQARLLTSALSMVRMDRTLIRKFAQGQAHARSSPMGGSLPGKSHLRLYHHTADDRDVA